MNINHVGNVNPDLKQRLQSLPVRRISFSHYRVPQNTAICCPRISQRVRVKQAYKNKPDPFWLVPYHRKRKLANGTQLEATSWIPFARGGKTNCRLMLEDGSIHFGSALCSMNDEFSYREGREIALRRAIDMAEDYIVSRVNVDP